MKDFAKWREGIKSAEKLMIKMCCIIEFAFATFLGPPKYKTSSMFPNNAKGSLL